MDKKKTTDGTYTFEEYENLLRESEVKYEFYDGHVRSMAGGTPNHSKIISRINAALHGSLFENGCEIFSSDLAVRIEEFNCYVYPDVSVVCEEPEYFNKNYLKNPGIIIEVLSKSTEGHDRGEKFAYYKSLPSVKEYVTVNTDKPLVFVNSKSPDNSWNVVVYFGLKGKMHLPNFDLEIPMSTLYERINFPA